MGCKPGKVSLLMNPRATKRPWVIEYTDKRGTLQKSYQNRKAAERAYKAFRTGKASLHKNGKMTRRQFRTGMKTIRVYGLR